MEPTDPTITDATPALRNTAPTARRPHQMIRLATTAGVAAASLATAAAGTPVLALISFNHNETLVTPGEPHNRRGKAAAGVFVATAAVSAGAAAVATPVLAFISINHNETSVGSVG